MSDYLEYAIAFVLLLLGSFGLFVGVYYLISLCFSFDFVFKHAIGFYLIYSLFAPSISSKVEKMDL